MEEACEDPVSFSKGINLRDLMTSGSEFHIDVDFSKKSPGDLFYGDGELFGEVGGDDDSDNEENILKNIEDSTDRMMLSSPEYQSFEKLATKMIDCLPSGDVKIMIIEEGQGPLVPVDAEVTMHYAAYWERATIPFDSTLTMNFGAPSRHRLGAGRLLPGLEVGLTTVRGPRAQLHLLLRPAAAWGPLGVPPRIRPEPALFVIQVYDVRDVQAALRFNDLPSEEQSKFEVTIRTVSSLHVQAKDQFLKKQYLRAVKNYQQSITVLKLSRPEGQEEESQVKNLKVSAFLNLAMCYHRLNKPKYVLRMLKSLDYVTDVDKHCKAQFYFGRAYELLGKTDEAIRHYKNALKLEPKNRDIGKALDNIDGYLKHSAKREKEMWQSVFKTEKKETFDVDEEFQVFVREQFEELASGEEYAKFDLPTGLSSGEVGFVKSLVDEFKGLVVVEDEQGTRRKVTIIKKLSC